MHAIGKLNYQRGNKRLMEEENCAIEHLLPDH
jgi:hypothetical protein